MYLSMCSNGIDDFDNDIKDVFDLKCSFIKLPDVSHNARISCCCPDIFR